MEVKSAKQRQKNRNRLDKLAAVAMATKKGVATAAKFVLPIPIFWLISFH
jgi:hypothetical protein